MALTDDILSIVLIAGAVLLAAIFVTVRILSQAHASTELKENGFKYDYYSNTADVFFHLQENVTNKPFNVLLGDYIYSSKPVVSTPNGTVDLRLATRSTLDMLYGKENYYFKVSPMITDVRISFVLDGTDSLKAERQTIAENMGVFKGNVSTLFPASAVINITVYIISSNDENVVCSQFRTQEIQCKRLGFAELYNPANEVKITPPEQYYVPGSYAQANPRIFYEADWVAGTQYAAQQYAAYLRTRTSGTGRLHIIIPVSNKLSTSSVADACFLTPASSTTLWSDYNSCVLCDDACPVDRSARFLAAVSDYVNATSTIIIPVFSSRCSFTYSQSMNQFFIDTPTTRQWLSIPVTTSPCAQSTCGGCGPKTPPADMNSYCFHDNCHDALRSQMRELAAPTGGTLVDIANPGELTRKVMESVSDSVSNLTIQGGVLNESRPRYVIERNILVPTYGKTTLRIWAYDPPEAAP